MTDPNAKLRTLRAKVLNCVKHWRAHEGIDGGYWQGRIWTAEYVVQRIDDLLAEPELCDIPIALADGWTYRCDKPLGHYGAHRAHLGTMPSSEPRMPPPRESLAEEVARLHGFVGPDGKGRP